MSTFAACPVCGLSVQVLSLDSAGVCPSCAAPLGAPPETIPVAERVPVAAPVARPIAQPGFDWGQVSGMARPEEIGAQFDERPSARPLAPGWPRVSMALAVNFSAVVLYLVGIFALVGLYVVMFHTGPVAEHEADERALTLALAFSGLGTSVSVALIAARFACCALGERRGNAGSLAWATALATLLSAAAAMLPGFLLVTGEARDIPGGVLVLMGFFSLVLGGVAELLFMMFVREVGRVLRDADTITATGRFFFALGVLAVAFVIAVVGVPLFVYVAGAFQPRIGGPVALLSMAAFAAAGLLLVVMYLLAISRGRAAIARRLREGHEYRA